MKLCQKRTLSKNLILASFLWTKRITLQKTCNLGVFIMLSIKMLKYMERTLCLGNKRTLRETCIMSVSFFNSLSTKKLKPTNNTLYLENKK